MPNDAELIVSNAMKPLHSFQVPQVLQELVDRYHSNLLSLASTLLVSGKSSEEASAAIEVVCSSFKAELQNTINVLSENEGIDA